MTSFIESFFEVYSPSAKAARHERYAKLGLTDCVTVMAADSALVITDDFPLSNVLFHLGRDAINLNHIRMTNWT